MLVEPTRRFCCKDRLGKGKERLDYALEALDLLCEAVEPPQGDLDYIHYFCGNTEISEDLKELEPKRITFYKSTVALIRAYANISDELQTAGYSNTQIARIKYSVDKYLKAREIVRKASGESLDLKAYEADMRHLIDTYIEANEPRKISVFDNMSLLELMVKTGIAYAIDNGLKELKGNNDAVAEAIENNVRSRIIKEHLNDPAYYDKMSVLLNEIVESRKARAIEYEEYLKQIAELAKKVTAGQTDDNPAQLNTPGRRALYNNLGKDEALALKVDEAVKLVTPDDWRDNQAKENVVKSALHRVLQDIAEVERIFLIIKQQKEY